MVKKTFYQFTEQDIRTLREIADDFRKRKKQEGPIEDFTRDHSPDTYVALIPEEGLPPMVGIGTADPIVGEAECRIFRLQRESGGSYLHEIVGCVRTVYNFTGSSFAGGYILITRLKTGHWVPVSGGSSYYKHLGRFTFDEELTTEDEAVWGTMTNEYGEGITHWGRDTDSGEGTATGSFGTRVRLHNFETHEDGVFEFYADSGDACIAYYDYVEIGEDTGTASATSTSTATGTEVPVYLVEHWQIVIPECP